MGGRQQPRSRAGIGVIASDAKQSYCPPRSLHEQGVSFVYRGKQEDCFGAARLAMTQGAPCYGASRLYALQGIAMTRGPLCQPRFLLRHPRAGGDLLPRPHCKIPAFAGMTRDAGMTTGSVMPRLDRGIPGSTPGNWVPRSSRGTTPASSGMTTDSRGVATKSCGMTAANRGMSGSPVLAAAG